MSTLANATIGAGKTIWITGASGLLGKGLVKSLEKRGYTVIKLVRREAEKRDELKWIPYEGVDESARRVAPWGIIHLAGAGVVDRRWTKAYKEEIDESRVRSMRRLFVSCKKYDIKPAVVLTASGMNYYGSHRKGRMSEIKDKGDGFLAKVTHRWEDACFLFDELGARTGAMRLGMILSRQGGALKKLEPFFKLGLGGPIGMGERWTSWIARSDAVRAAIFFLENDALSGGFNVVSPQPVTNKRFTAALAQALHRPAFMPIPPLMLQMMYGRDMANETILSDLEGYPERLMGLGFEFSHTEIESTMHRMYSA